MMNFILNPELQLVLDDSERIRHILQDFRPVLDEIYAVCDMSSQKEKLDQNDQQVHKMQRKILEPLEHLLQAVGVNTFQFPCRQVVSDPKWQWGETTGMTFPSTSFRQRGFSLD